MKTKPFRPISLLPFIALALGALLAACSNASHALLYQQSNLGLNAGINPATQNLAVRIGLRRQFGAIVPKYAKDSTPPAASPSEDGGASGNEASTEAGNQAASTFFGSRARISSPFRVPEVSEVMVTGRAAVIAAQAGNALDFTESETESGTTPPPAEN